MAKRKRVLLSTKSRLPKPKKSGEHPATKRMLYEVRNELKSDISSVRLEIKALSKNIDARFNKMDARFNEMDAKFAMVMSAIAKVQADIHRVLTIVEEQNARLEDMNANHHRMPTLMEERYSQNKASFEGAESMKTQKPPDTHLLIQ